MSFSTPTDPTYLLRNPYPGFRAATLAELQVFAKKYRPARWFPIHAIAPQSLNGPFGPTAQVFKTTTKGQTEKVEFDFVRGLPAGTAVLFVKIES